MPEKKIPTRIPQKHDTEENWIKAVNFTPKNGEFIIYDEDENYSYKRVKIGDGVNNVNSLPLVDNHKMDKFGVVTVDNNGNTSITCEHGNLTLVDAFTFNTDGTITMGNTTLTEEKLIELINLKQYVDEMIGTIESQLAAI